MVATAFLFVCFLLFDVQSDEVGEHKLTKVNGNCLADFGYTECVQFNGCMNDLTGEYKCVIYEVRKLYQSID